MIQTILSAFAFGTFWFWALTIVASIIFIASIENDHYTTPTITAIILGIIFWTPLIALGWQTIALSVGAYALIGVVWSLFKWYRYVQKTSSKYRSEYGTTLTERTIGELKRDLSVSNNKSRLTGWIAWWPWSLAWGITGDFFNMLYDLMVNAYEKITNQALGKFTQEVKKEVITNDTNNTGGYRGSKYSV